MSTTLTTSLIPVPDNVIALKALKVLGILKFWLDNFELETTPSFTSAKFTGMPPDILLIEYFAIRLPAESVSEKSTSSKR